VKARAQEGALSFAELPRAEQIRRALSFLRRMSRDMHRAITKVDFLCKDCGFDTHKGNEYYMVQNAVWREAKGGRGLLCIQCLEKRLKRRLKPKDFTNAPINIIFPRSRRMNARMPRRAARIKGSFRGVRSEAPSPKRHARP
jgi:hypothetical protein